MYELFHKIVEEAKKIGRGISTLRFFKFADIPKFFRYFSRNEKWALAIFTTLLIGTSLFGITRWYIHHTKPIPALGGTYTEALVGQPHFLNPILAQGQTDQDISRLVFSGLYKVSPQGALIPDLAASAIQISPDQKTYTVRLKPNLKWHDGQPITADDVVFTIEAIQNPNYKSPFNSEWKNITVQELDSLTVQFTNTTVSSPFVTNLTIGILPKHLWSQVSPENFSTSQYNLQPIGSGPFFVKEISKLSSGTVDSISLESYSNYWAGKAYLDAIDFKFYDNYEDALFALHAKDVQSFGFIPFDKKVYVDQATKFSVMKLPVFEYQGLFFNEAQNPNVLGDLAVRTALAESVDRNELIGNVYNGLANAAYSPIMSGQIGYDPAISQIHPYSVSAAETVLDKDGWVLNASTGYRNKGSTALQFTITTNDFVLNEKSAEDLQAQWKKIGVQVRLNIVPTAQLQDNYIKTRNYDSILFAESTGLDPDPFSFWHSSQAQGSGLNLSSYRNTQVDSLISQARNTFNPAVRAADYQQFQEILAADLPAIILDQTLYVYQTSPNIKGIQLEVLANPEDRFYDVNQWYTETKRVWK